MTTFYINSTQGGFSLNSTDAAYINSGVSINGNISINAGDTRETLFINGTVNGQVADILATGSNDSIVVGSTGSILSPTAVGISLFGGGHTIVNAGFISGFQAGVVISSGTSTSSRIFLENTGTIIGSGAGGFAGMSLSFSGLAPATIANAGTLIGRVGLGAGSDNFTNTGTIIGDVDLSQGSNFFDTRSGVVTGTIWGGNDGNKILGSAGDDQIVTGSGSDIINGGAGADQMSGGDGNDVYYVDNGDDTLFDTGGADVVKSSITLDLADLNVTGVFETLLLTGSAAIDGRGTEAQDNIVGNAASNVLEGRGGDDVLSGRSGKDTLYGGAGNDRLDGGRGADQMLGGAGDDTYFVDDAGDVVNEADTGSSGNDTVYSSVSFDLSDTLHSKGVIEQLQLTGDQAIDATGNSAANVLAGNTAANVLDGKGGNDTLIGSSGADTFKFTTALSATKNVDVISDFVHGIDIIALDHTIFAALTTLGVLNDTAFALNAAVSSTQHIIYNTTTGALSYDPDGNGAAAAVQFATLTNLTLVSASDFLVI